jgi:hypothetical protein
MRWHDGLWARASNLLLGGWLLVSAFAWQHSLAQRTDDIVVGYLCFLAALAATRIPSARHVNSLIAVWLLLSTFALPHAHVETVVNGALVALAMFLLSLVHGWSRPAGAMRHALLHGAHVGSTR